MICKRFRPRANAPEMSGVANGHSRYAMRYGARGGNLHRFLADDLTKAEVAVDDHKCAAVADDACAPVRANLARAQPIDIFRDTDHAMRVVAHQARFDQMGGDNLGFARHRAGRDEDGSYECLYA
jgi:hypothetical protein